MIECSKNVPLNTRPHYTDTRFQMARTVFGSECADIGYEYSDRLWHRDYDKAQIASEVAGKSGKVPRSCAWYEVYLSAYFDKPVEIKHIMAGVNVSDGYPYCVFGFKEK